jgi:hypothetical protein
MTHWRHTMVDRPETDGAVYVAGWTIPDLAVLAVIIAVWVLRFSPAAPLRPGGSATLSVTDFCQCGAVMGPAHSLGSVHAGQCCSLSKNRTLPGQDI